MVQNKEEVMKLFMQDLARGPERALRYSFPKYADQRDALIAEYSRVTGIPEEEFSDAMLARWRDELLRCGPVID